MNVLLLHQHFNTPQQGGAVRSYYLAKALVDSGIGVTVMTGGEHHYRKTNHEGIDIYYLPIPYNNRFGFSARAASFIRYIWQVMRHLDKVGVIDVCYAISTPLTIGLAARWIKQVRKIPFIFEVGDLWPEAPIQLGFVQNPFFKLALYNLEKSIYNAADRVVALSDPIAKSIHQKVPRKPVDLIPNMSDIDFYRPSEKDPAQEQQFGVIGKRVVSYIGALGFANGLDYYLECARASKKAELNLHFFICGDGAMLDYLKRTAAKLELNNLTIYPFQDRQGVKALMNITDFAFVCYKTVPILETGSPNKYFDGLAAGKMIIVNFGGWIKSEIESNACGIAVDPFHPTDFVKQIEPFLNDVERLRKYQQQARVLAETKYSRQLIGNRFASIFKTHY